LLALGLVTARFWLPISESRPALAATFNAYTLSVGLNDVLPGRLAELVKGTYLRRHGQVSYSGLIAPCP
jgi:hypothetical protein